MRGPVRDGEEEMLGEVITESGERIVTGQPTLPLQLSVGGKDSAKHHSEAHQKEGKAHEGSADGAQESAMDVGN